MKLKYYLRGLGIGIIITTIVLMISFSMHKETISDEQIIARAEALGMEFSEDTLFPKETEDTETTTEASEMTETSEDTQTKDDKSDTEKTDDAKPEDTASDEAEDAQDSENGQDVNNSEQADSESAENEPAKEDAAENEGDAEKEDYLLTINRGAVCRDICEELYENGLVDDSEALRVYLGNVGYASNISVGKYKIPYGLSYEEIYKILKAGPIEE